MSANRLIALLILALFPLPGRMAPIIPAASEPVVIVASDPRLRLFAHPPVVVMSFARREPYLFSSSHGTLFCQAEMDEPPFGSKGRAAYEHRIGSAISRDGGRTWLQWTDRKNHDDVNIEGGMTECRDGTILMLDYYVVPTSRREHGTGELWKSHDDLCTFERPAYPDFDMPGVRFEGSTEDNGKAERGASMHRSLLEMPNGDLLALMYYRFSGDNAASAYRTEFKKLRVVLFRSHDRGASWHYLSTVAVDSGVGTEGFNEAVMVRLSHRPHAGRLLCLMRTGRQLYQAHSDDDGLNWSHAEPAIMPGMDIYAVHEWEALFGIDPTSPRYVPQDAMIGAMVDPDLIEMRDGTLVCSVGLRAPAQLSSQNWRSPRNGDYLGFSLDGGDTWSQVVEFRSGQPSAHYTAVREIGPGRLYVVYDKDPDMTKPKSIMGFALDVKRTDAGPGEPSTILADRSKSALNEMLLKESGWTKVHAAEALIAGGEGAIARRAFAVLDTDGPAFDYRIGVWRVMARTAATDEERRDWIDKIEGVFLDPKSSTQGWADAIETLAKLRQRINGRTLALARERAAEKEPAFAVGPLLWALALADEPFALERIAELLHSSEPEVRRSAAYCVRWLAPSDPTVRGAIAQAAEDEPDGTIAAPYVLAAAIAADGDSTALSRWQRRLAAVLESGSPAEKFEACQTLYQRMTAADLAQLTKLLDASESDSRIAAGWAILGARRHP